MLPDAEGCAHVGEHVDGAIWCLCAGWPVESSGIISFSIASKSARLIALSFPFATLNRRETLNVRVSTSTS